MDALDMIQPAVVVWPARSSVLAYLTHLSKCLVSDAPS